MTNHGMDGKSIALDRDIFFRSLIRELAGTSEEIVGIKEASGFVSVVGQRIGAEINRNYRSALKTEQLDRSQVVAVYLKSTPETDAVEGREYVKA